MTPINLVLPSPPGLNSLYYTRIVKSKYPPFQPMPIRGLTTEGQDYKQTVAEIADGMQPFIGDVWVTFKWYRPRRIGDLDGIFKIILDGLKGHAYYDDKQVARIHADRFDDKGAPRVEVEIQGLGLC